MKVHPPKEFGGCLSVSGFEMKNVSGTIDVADAIGRELISFHGFVEVKDTPVSPKAGDAKPAASEPKAEEAKGGDKTAEGPQGSSQQKDK